MGYKISTLRFKNVNINLIKFFKLRLQNLNHVIQ